MDSFTPYMALRLSSHSPTTMAGIVNTCRSGRLPLISAVDPNWPFIVVISGQVLALARSVCMY